MYKMWFFNNKWRLCHKCYFNYNVKTLKPTFSFKKYERATQPQRVGLIWEDFRELTPELCERTGGRLSENETLEQVWGGQLFHSFLKASIQSTRNTYTGPNQNWVSSEVKYFASKEL